MALLQSDLAREQPDVGVEARGLQTRDRLRMSKSSTSMRMRSLPTRQSDCGASARWTPSAAHERRERRVSAARGLREPVRNLAAAFAAPQTAP